MPSLKPFRVINEEKIAGDNKFSLIESHLLSPLNENVTWKYIKVADGVIMLPIDNESNVYLKKEWRVNRKDFVWEVPGGYIDEKNPTEQQIKDAAQRELQEEIGVKSNNLKKVFTFYVSNHITTKLHIFLGRDLVPSELPKDDHEYIEVQKLPFDEAYKLITETQIPNAQTLLAFLLVTSGASFF